jgi:hypothetical protein
MKRLLLAASLLLPLGGLAVGWAVTDYRARQGTDWEIPVAGYDPRDLLRGHYIAYQYAWPGLKGEDEFTSGADGASALCLEGTAPIITRTVNLDKEPQPCATKIRPTPGSEQTLTNGIIYISQTKADAMQKQLGDPKVQSFIRVRIREDGIMRPLELVFRPRAK